MVRWVEISEPQPSSKNTQSGVAISFKTPASLVRMLSKVKEKNPQVQIIAAEVRYAEQELVDKIPAQAFVIFLKNGKF